MLISKLGVKNSESEHWLEEFSSESLVVSFYIRRFSGRRLTIP